ncbi:GtrA family protein [Oceanispirochaeta crateris]|uniref:GtrA family protein n=1 Tax=Oceanispirochaeta crateris TaxID=2518645 RepID=A0A5C1QIW7_9SPIO|nr:GtrA family protein [Oceanispirochaeta crateris]QEN06990.1 GtrA family protein [Oceanispirochaeta crateris]
MNNFKMLFIQAVKFGIVGFLNTAVTFIVIILFKELIGFSIYIANFAGYAAGLMNSFIWNRAWTFKSNQGDLKRQVFLFIAIWCFCFAIQMGVLFLLVDIAGIFEYVSVFMAMVVYTILNFILNRWITFNSKSNAEDNK